MLRRYHGGLKNFRGTFLWSLKQLFSERPSCISGAHNGGSHTLHGYILWIVDIMQRDLNSRPFVAINRIEAVV
jgi:hypothetical protein